GAGLADLTVVRIRSAAIADRARTAHRVPEVDECVDVDEELGRTVLDVVGARHVACKAVDDAGRHTTRGERQGWPEGVDDTIAGAAALAVVGARAARISGAERADVGEEVALEVADAVAIGQVAAD